jgi:feruloyl-CoA synthase
MAKFREVRLGQRGNEIERQNDGTILLRSPEPLGTYKTRYTEPLEQWAAAAPDRIYLAQRTAEGEWRSVTYAQALDQVRCLAQALIDRGLSEERPLMILSGNSIEHALLGLAAMHIGVPYSPISVGFSLLSQDHAKLRHAYDLLTPGLVFADNGDLFQRAIQAVVGDDVEVAVAGAPFEGRTLTAFSDLASTTPNESVDTSAGNVTGDSIAKILFTSGSTAMPKGVINSHRMLCANQQMTAQAFPFLTDEPPVMLDWLPWNHTFGGNFVFGMGLFNGASGYIDDGKPLPGEVEKTVRNIKDVRPTLYHSVPRGYELLLPYLREDAELRDAFFGRMKYMLYAAASLPQQVWAELRQMGIDTTGERIFTTEAIGSTETSPLAVTCNWDADEPGILGLPIPGQALKLVPSGSKLEVRLKGPNVTPGYWRQPELTANGFDQDGWYCIGDAMRLADPDDVNRGLRFDGRIAEDFKLLTGVWVNVGPLRATANGHLSPLVRDCAVTGSNRDDIGLLIFPEIALCREVAGLDDSLSDADVVAHPAVQAEFQKRLDLIATEGNSSSNRIVRAMVIAEPLADVEVTDKNTLSYNLVLERRAADVEELYMEPPTARVLRPAAAARAAE